MVDEVEASDVQIHCGQHDSASALRPYSLHNMGPHLAGVYFSVCFILVPLRSTSCRLLGAQGYTDLCRVDLFTPDLCCGVNCLGPGGLVRNVCTGLYT